MAAVSFKALGNTTVIVVASVYALLLPLAMFAGFFGVFLTAMILLSLWRYSYAILRHVARGWNHFPPPDMESTNPFGEMAVVFHYVFFGSLTVLLVTTPFIPVPLRVIALGGVALVFPGSAAVMGMTNSLPAALSPSSVWTVARELGADYAKLVAVCVLLVALGGMSGLLWQVSWLLGVAGEMFAVWTTLALFLAIGAALRAHRFDFDLLEGADDAEQREQRERQSEWQKTLDRAYTSVRSGLTAQAYRTIKELVASDGDSLEVYQWTFNGMLAWDEPHHAALLGERFARRLWDEDRKVDALELAERCRKISPQFAPPAAFTAELAAYARSLGRHRSADELTALAAATAVNPDISQRAPGP
ncbi:MAG TPA: hypothetical protein VKA43_12675 [Gammaproteobacteria bacterium]|nr:hypothetical protein [Gammaproteobacteria bacterium]